MPIQRPKKVKIKRGRAGLGLFAAEGIRRGDFVIEYTGKKISNEEADRRAGRYLFEINSRWAIDGLPRSNRARYINHSCRPNCEPAILRGKIKIYAKRNIKEGEELSYDYGKEYFNDIIKTRGCRCEKCNP